MEPYLTATSRLEPSLMLFVHLWINRTKSWSVGTQSKINRNTDHSKRSRYGVQSGVLSEPQQICGEKTRNQPWKNQILFLLRRFVLGANKASWLSGQRVRLSVSRRGIDSWTRRILLSLSPRPRHLSTPPNIADECLLGGRVVSVATLPVMVSRLGCGSWFKSDPRLNAAGSPLKPGRGSLESGRMGNTSPATEPLRRPTQPHTDELRVGR